MSTEIRNVVLVHGGFVDGSGWQAVHRLLTADGFTVKIVQNPTLSLDGDVEATRFILDGLDGPAVLVGHSYGGAVITAAGTHDGVAALVYIAAFAPDKGESVNTLISGFPTDGPQPPILPPRDGWLFLDRDKVHASFAADLPAADGAFLADSQVPWNVNVLGGVVTDPAWRHKPSSYLVATQDRMIPRPRSGQWSPGSAPSPPRRSAATPCTCPSPAPSPTSSARPRRPTADRSARSRADHADHHVPARVRRRRVAAQRRALRQTRSTNPNA